MAVVKNERQQGAPAGFRVRAMPLGVAVSRRSERNSIHILPCGCERAAVNVSKDERNVATESEANEMAAGEAIFGTAEIVRNAR